MNEQEAINFLKEKDIKKIIKKIKNYKLKVVYWQGNQDFDDEINLWFIDNEYFIDFLSYQCDLYLHWTQIYEELIDAIKKEIKYEIDE